MASLTRIFSSVILLVLLLAWTPLPVQGNKRLVGYYIPQQSCSKLGLPSAIPKNIPADLYTHLYFSFALVTSSHTIKPSYSDDIPLYKQMRALKLKNPALKTLIAVGGSDMNPKYASQMLSTSRNRKKFINSAIKFCHTYGFNGIDLDWEYPITTADKRNLVTFAKEFRAAAKAEQSVVSKQLIITITLPGDGWFGKKFDIAGLSKHVAFFNLMSYDYHGPWESKARPAASRSDLPQAISYLPTSVPRSKFNLGLQYEGNTFTLKSSSHYTPGSSTTGAGHKGSCDLDSAGYLSYPEIMKIKKAQSKTAHRAGKSGLDYIWMHYSKNQWVSFDDATTLKAKVKYALSKGIGGVFAWGIFSDMPTYKLTTAVKGALGN